MVRKIINASVMMLTAVLPIVANHQWKAEGCDSYHALVGSCIMVICGLLTVVAVNSGKGY